MDQGFCLPEDILEDVEGSHHNLLGVGDIHHNPLVGEAVPERKINENWEYKYVLFYYNINSIHIIGTWCNLTGRHRGKEIIEDESDCFRRNETKSVNQSYVGRGHATMILYKYI